MPINMDKEIWEGWRVKDFIERLEPLVDMIMYGEALHKPFKTKEEMAAYITDWQPYYKKRIPGVIEYFAEKYNLE